MTDFFPPLFLFYNLFLKFQLVPFLPHTNSPATMETGDCTGRPDVETCHTPCPDICPVSPDLPFRPTISSLLAESPKRFDPGATEGQESVTLVAVNYEASAARCPQRGSGRSPPPPSPPPPPPPPLSQRLMRNPPLVRAGEAEGEDTVMARGQSSVQGASSAGRWRKAGERSDGGLGVSEAWRLSWWPQTPTTGACCSDNVAPHGGNMSQTHRPVNDVLDGSWGRERGDEVVNTRSTRDSTS